jgi:hypothetical protein
MLRVAWRAMIISALLILLLGFTSLETIPLMAAVILLMLAPVFIAFRSWVERLDQVDASK